MKNKIIMNNWTRNYLMTVFGGLLVLLLFTQCKSQENTGPEISACVKQQYIPVIKGMDNEVLELAFELNNEAMLEAIHLEIEGAEALKGIKVYAQEDKGATRIPLAELVEVEDKAIISLQKELPKGKHRLVLHVNPKASASLKETIRISVNKLELEKNRVNLKMEGENRPFRLATSLRTKGDDGVAAYRIPGLVTSAKGTLLAVYDIRRNNSVDLQEDIDVGLSRSTDGGASWEPMQVIMDMGQYGGKPEDENGIGDPAILVDPEDNTIYVVALWAHGKPGQRLWFSSQAGMSPEETGQLMLVKSEDDGQTWSEPINITAKIKNPAWKLMFNGPGKGITMRNGTLVFAAQYKDENDMPHSTLIYSKDKGETWHIGTGAKSNTTEAQVVELNDGSLMLNMRDNRGGSRSVAVTRDLGQTWEDHSSSKSALPEPVCMASLITFPENRREEEASWLFFSNPAATDGRYNMTIKASKDQGNSWPATHHLLLDSQKGWGYSCLTVIDEDHLGILYESSQAHMTFQVVPIRDVLKD